VLKLGRTIADLAECDQIQSKHDNLSLILYEQVYNEPTLMRFIKKLQAAWGIQSIHQIKLSMMQPNKENECCA